MNGLVFNCSGCECNGRGRGDKGREGGGSVTFFLFNLLNSTPQKEDT